MPQAVLIVSVGDAPPDVRLDTHWIQRVSLIHRRVVPWLQEAPRDILARAVVDVGALLIGSEHVGDPSRITTVRQILVHPGRRADDAVAVDRHVPIVILDIHVVRQPDLLAVGEA